MKKILTNVFKEICKRLLKGLSNQEIGKNAKGQTTKYFDKHTENHVISILKQKIKFKAFIISEESKERIVINENMGNKPYYIIIDPVDGSDNYANGIPFVSFGLAIFDYGLKPVYSFVGNYYTGDYIYSNKKRIFLNGGKFNKIIIKKQDRGKLLFLAVKNSKFKHKDRLFNFLGKFESVRCLGSTIGEIILVIKGKATAFMDYRNELTLENFAPFLLISKLGGCEISDENGNEIILKSLSMTKPYNIIISNNKAIHDEILEKLKKIK